MNKQFNIFDYLQEDVKITKPIRLIEFFAGYGSQNLALKYLGAKYESWKICEWATKSIQAYKDLHHSQDNNDYSKELTFDEIKEKLFSLGISADYNKPMTYDQIKRKGESWCRNVYNNIIATNNLVNIQQVKGKDLNIIDTDKYDYVLTYSFPCQDLSLAGKGAGMEKGSGTRSGMLWEVERILKECDKLPHILLMENVTQIHSKKNKDNFNLWIKALNELGYASFWKDMNSKNYGVPQNRDRTFMISILKSYNSGKYEFPQGFKLELTLADMLEDEVDEKYYLSDSLLNCFMSDGTGKFPRKERFLSNINRPNQDIANAVTTLAGNRPTDNFVVENSQNVKRLFGLFDNEKGKHQAGSVYDIEGLSPTLDTAQGGYRQPCIKIPEATKKGYAEAYEGLRIRKLTPKECGRLMGVHDCDIERMSKNQSNSSLYHLFGDSIVVDVLMNIFKNLLV